MKKDKETFERIIEDSDSIIFTKDLSGHYIFVNEQFEKSYGDSRENITSKTDLELFPKELAESYYKDDLIVIEKKIPIQFNEIDHKRPEFHYITNKFPLYNSGELYGIGGIATNVSEKVQSEREKFTKQLAEKKQVEEQLKISLQKKEIQLNAIIDNNPDWIIFLDRDGTWIDYHDTESNPLTEYIRKANPNGKNIREFLAPDFSGELLRLTKECLDNQSLVKNESTNSKNQFFEEYYVPLSANEIMLIVRNITDRKSVEVDLKKRTNELEEANSQLIEFSYVLSHDLKSPLTVMNSLIDSMMIGEKDESNLDRLKLKIDSMIQLVNGLLKFSEITHSKEKVPYEIVDCNILIKEIIETLNPKNFEIEIMDNLPKLNYHKVKLYQLFQNLLSNSIKYNNKAKGIIKVSGQKSSENNLYTFSFYDNGIGIESNDYNKIFNVFSKGGKNRSKIDPSSSGIGLSIVKKIIDSMGGEIKVESILDVETRFLIDIPAYFVVTD